MNNNKNVMYVTLTNNSANAEVYEKDFKELLSFGLPHRWNYHQGHVWVRHKGRNLQVARLILDADKGQKVVQIDKSPLNLKRENLLLKTGKAKHRTRDLL